MVSDSIYCDPIYWKRAVADPKVREQIAAQGIEPVSNTPAEFRAFVNSELEKWARVVKAAGIKGD